MSADGATGSDGRAARVAAILAGGASSRMGEPKARVELLGRPLIAYAIDAARLAGLEPLLVAKRPADLPAIDCEVLSEPWEPRHPAVGIVAALERVGAPVVVLPCDAPLVPPELLADLASRTSTLAMPAEPRPQPLVARYSPAALLRLREAIVGGDSMLELAADLGGERLEDDELSAFGDPQRMFANANDRADLGRLAAEFDGRGA